MRATDRNRLARHHQGIGHDDSPKLPVWLMEPSWYLWDGGFLLLGRSEGIVDAHAHHAIQIVVALQGEPALRAADCDWLSGPGFIVLPDAVHSYDGRGAHGAMLFVDPESNEGDWLRANLVEPVTRIPDAHLANCAPSIRRFFEQPQPDTDVRALVRDCILSLCAGAPPERRRDARVTASLRTIRESKDLRVSLDDIAATVFLSPSRFAHLFVQQVGLPFRRYVLWRKLARAMLAIGNGRTMTEAAQAADFSDAAHLTRTFNQMLGIAPSALMRGRFLEIGSPFES